MGNCLFNIVVYDVHFVSLSHSLSLSIFLLFSDNLQSSLLGLKIFLLPHAIFIFIRTMPKITKPRLPRVTHISLLHKIALF